MNGDKAFIDTNILVYAHDADAGQKHEIAYRLLMELWENRSGVLSTQVLHEFYVTITRKVLHPLSRDRVRNIINDYLAWHIEVSDPSTILTASRIEENYRISFWDALIITSASKAKAAKIFTEDLQTGQWIEGILIENPFK
ncbi:MAG TPA: PIN domain-containing protein [Thermodesulfobacteriota bacterium]|nr:PIN domain-containing protein [Thermodesulfobacteriota bacterium]